MWKITEAKKELWGLKNAKRQENIAVYEVK